MSARTRLTVFLAACATFLPGVVLLILQMPAFGAHAQPYADLINRSAPLERRVANAVSAVNFDYRALDTLGEEFMLLCAVTGVVVLLRSKRGERADAPPGRLEGRTIRPRSDAVSGITRLLAPVTFLFGLDVALHGMTTPGGGFQGGAILASALFMVFLGEGYRGWRRIAPSVVFDVAEGAGATLYSCCGFAALLVGLPFLTNFLPLGTWRDLVSGGLMLIENAGVTLAVAGGFTVLFGEFLEETRAESPGDSAR
jgi:multicomponent Na+:H+ antiporter subunit B